MLLEGYHGTDLGVKDLNPLHISAIKIGGKAKANSARANETVPELVRRAGTFMLGMLRRECARGIRVAGLEPHEAVDRLKEQIPKFLKKSYPFDRKVLSSDGPQQWWARLNLDQGGECPSNEAQPLAVSAFLSPTNFTRLTVIIYSGSLRASSLWYQTQWPTSGQGRRSHG